MGWFAFWLALLVFAALIVVPKIKEWHAQGQAAAVPYREMWQKRTFCYSLPIPAEEAMARLSNQLGCAGMAYVFDPALMQITLRNELPDGTVPITFQLSFTEAGMLLTRLTRTTKAGPIQLAMGAFWQKKLGAKFIRCE